MALKVKERNSFNHLVCPYCSRLHQMEDRGGPLDLPTRCLRCKCPLDEKAAEAFIEQRAVAEFDQAIHEAGKKLRGEYGTDEVARLREEVAELRRELGRKRAG